jgi:gliding motility-associated-like protein
LQHISIAQGEANNWYFGIKAAINFNSGSPQAIFNSEMSAAEGCSSISDHNGNLHFYSDGYFIWNHNHQRMMDNGSFSIIGDNADGSQTGVIVPWPDNDSLYYVFSLGQLGGNLYYSVVNINHNNGLGEVVVKKVLLQKSVCEKLTAVRHCNKHDYWVISHKFNSDEYCSFLISSSGISTIPVLSATGNFVVNTDGTEFSKTMGYLKNSPDGRLLAAAHYVSDYVELTDFNSSTGTISNPRKLYVRPEGVVTPVFDGAYGLEFSRSSRLLYVSSYYGPPNNDTTALYQFDVTQNGEAAIQASRVFIYGADWSYNTLTALQSGPDGKIYVAKYGYYLSVINFPEIQGQGCQFISNAIYIDDGSLQHHSNFGLPNFIQSYFNDPVIATGNCEFSNISFSLQNLIDVNYIDWNFGDPGSGSSNTSQDRNPTHIFSQEGQYQIKAVIHHLNGCGADTVYKLIHAGKFKVFLGRDTTICQGNTLTLKMNVPNGMNLWNNNSIDTIVSVSNAGHYWVNVRLGDCIASDTVSVAIRDLPLVSLGNDTVICNNEKLTLFAKNNANSPFYLWNTGETTCSVIVNNKGLYWVKLSDDLNCQTSDSIVIDYKSLPDFSLGNDTALCQTSIQLKAIISGASAYLWNTGENTSSIAVNTTGTYWADVTKDNCTYRDSIDVVFKPYPILNLGKDTILCEDKTLLLDAQNIGSMYQWQDNSSDQIYLVTKPGKYFVTVTADNCSSRDTISVNYDLKPVFSLGQDFSICSGETVTLKPTIQTGESVDYLWQDGSNNISYNVTSPGIYTLTLSNDCGSRSDSIVAIKGICKLFVPNAFTPNGDRLNDVFKATYGDNVTKFKMEIYNRWGQKVFESSDISRGWDGTYRQNILTGVFVWIIKYDTVDLKNRVLKGTVILIK